MYNYRQFQSLGVRDWNGRREHHRRMNVRECMCMCVCVCVCVRERQERIHRKPKVFGREAVHGRARLLPELDVRIVGGQSTTIEAFPYQVSIMYVDMHFCGGSIVHQSYVVTAAHCTDGFPFENLMVRAGSSLVDQGGQVIPVAKVIQHKQFDDVTMDFDISVLLLSRALEFNEAVEPISLPQPNAPVADNILGYASGWGRLSEGGFLPMELQMVQLPTVNKDECQALYQDNEITDRMLCAGYLEGGKDTCEGDSGGPLAANGVLIGITSWGQACAAANSPGVFTKVSLFTDFIYQVISGEA